jgi:hypothetical protein
MNEIGLKLSMKENELQCAMKVMGLQHSMKDMDQFTKQTEVWRS